MLCAIFLFAYTYANPKGKKNVNQIGNVALARRVQISVISALFDSRESTSVGSVAGEKNQYLLSATGGVRWIDMAQ